MIFTTNWLSSFLADTSGKVEDHIAIEQIMTDSRKQIKNSLFVPIVGENFDGHDFIKQAIDHGAVATLWAKDRDLSKVIPTGFPVFFVEDTVSALQEMAAQYRDKINPTVIGVTGSNGKTSTKDMISSVMKSTYRTHFTDGNFNNEIGLPLTILAMDQDTEVLVLEMGMSDFGEIELLSDIAKPDYAVITNIGESHIEFLGSRQGIAKAKLEITSGLKGNGKLIIDGDEELLRHVHNDPKVITCGFKPYNDVTIYNVEIKHDQTVFNLSDDITYTVPLLGEHQAQNASYAITLGKLMGIDSEVIKNALHTLSITSMRFEMLKGKNDVAMINDAYNASPTSMKAAVEVVKQMKGFSEKVLILGDIFELGEHSIAMHQSVADVIDESVTALFTVGKDSRVISEAVQEKQLPVRTKHVEVKEDLVESLQPYLKKDTLLLFKASRGMQFESLINKLQNI
ncbi:UDP-N-acetylmuramoyl-tripeptide--D-alanyl-D-alanine ligase [Ornithinibacillus sp. L9]|uniref:UDP-N-acetylmuramoyl-tripeptide--D-alanyl-D-alanine ligase n=1 Tax=Ornithinibacillus caprae TaxID=2678566 RepID=A0A6N8FJE9_9BACI|nr:UDP-N-acetylmuramoyl-tripeptide--D-alanyl-D-alanine ligase [Ornithinibacillus caprae]MUK89533.1 UDP-N-acetylmuramoyl-tripeptide--D-alanyl-D-alanine ligase [Ornithinibacillus caprae]